MFCSREELRLDIVEGEGVVDGCVGCSSTFGDEKAAGDDITIVPGPWLVDVFECVLLCTKGCSALLLAKHA